MSGTTVYGDESDTKIDWKSLPGSSGQEQLILYLGSLYHPKHRVKSLDSNEVDRYLAAIKEFHQRFHGDFITQNHLQVHLMDKLNKRMQYRLQNAARLTNRDQEIKKNLSIIKKTCEEIKNDVWTDVGIGIVIGLMIGLAIGAKTQCYL
ncbi:MAG: hypothetical protein ACTSUE_22890 [Promethearchaeota archaeon]